MEESLRWQKEFPAFGWGRESGNWGKTRGSPQRVLPLLHPPIEIAGTSPTMTNRPATTPVIRARKHGLNVPVMRDPDVGADVAFMAEEIDQSRYINTINEPMRPAFVETN